MDRTEIIAGVDFVRSVMEYHRDRLTAGHTETDAEAAAWDEGARYIEEQSALVRRLDERDQQLARAGEFLTTHPATAPVDGDGSLHVPQFTPGDRSDPFDLSTVSVLDSAAQLRGRAMTAIERMENADDDVKEAATRTLAADDREGTIARRYLFTGSDAYRSAFIKLVAGDDHGLTPDEREAVSRAMSLTDGSGGYKVPFLIDPTVVITTSGTTNPFRVACRVVQGTSDTWNGVNSGGVSARWAAEASQANDDSPTLTQPSIPAHKADSFVPFSIEIGQDYPGLEADIRAAMMEAKDDLEAAAFATGSGTGQPTGLVSALVASSPTVIVTSTGSNTFAKGDFTGLRTSVGPKYRARGTWFADAPILEEIAAFGTTLDAYSVDYTSDLLPTLRGRPVVESSEMDSSYGSGENYVLIFGDAQNYVIYDRIGMSVELVPMLFGTANNRPTGERGFYAHWRVGADCRNDNAFRILNVT